MWIWLGGDARPLAEQLPASAVFNVVRADQQEKQLLELGFTNGGMSFDAGREIELAEGEQIQVKLVVRDKSELSSVFTP